MSNYPLQMTIETTDGEGILQQIYFTELGHVMAKIYNPKSKTWTNRRIGNLESLLNENQIKLKGYTSLKSSTIKKMGK